MVNPACRRSRASAIGARNEKQVELPAPHFEEPRSVRVPSRLPSTTSPVRSRLTARKYDSAGPATIAMSPATANRATAGASAAASTGAPPASATTSSAARLAQLFRVRRVRELAELAGDEVGGLLADVDGVVADPLETARDDEHTQPPLALLRAQLEDVRQ